MVKRFVFVRHGDYAKAGLSEADKKSAPLTETGAEQALAAGEWLTVQGIKPDELISTQAERARETAEWLMLALEGAVDAREVRSGFALGKTGLDEKLAEWGCYGETVVFVGHCKQQQLLAKTLGGSVKRAERAVLVCERDDDGSWVLLDEATVG